MTIEYKGIRRRTTDVLSDYSQAHYLQNARLKRIGELGRRAGLGKSTMAKLTGPVQFMIGSWNYEPYIVNGTGGDVTGNSDPLAKWTGSTLRIPEGDAGQPSAPVIVSITGAPLVGAFNQGNTTFTATVTYAGGAGTLAYSWPASMADGFGGVALAVGPTNGLTCVYNFNGGAPPGSYTGTNFIVTTQFFGLSDTSPFFYTIV